MIGQIKELPQYVQYYVHTMVVVEVYTTIRDADAAFINVTTVLSPGVMS